MNILKPLFLCAIMSLTYACSDADSGGRPGQPDPIELLDLLPAATRGVFQVYPGAPGAMVGPVTTATWGQGPLQILQNYSTGMDIASAARRIVLGQLSDASYSFVLLAELATTEVEALSASLDLTAIDSYQGYPLWAIGSSDLQLAQLDRVTLAIGPSAALELVLDVYAGAEDPIELGPLGAYLTGLNAGTPNSFIYALPALYGAVAAPGNGDASLSQARVVNGAFGIEDDMLTGELSFYSDNAVTFSNRLLELLEGYTAPAIVASGDIASVNLAGLSLDEDIRPLLKTLFLDMDAVDYTDAVIQGGNPPWLNFKVGENPNAIFINFEFTGPAARADFEATHLPAGFTLAPIRVLESESPRYFLVLNIYQSSGGLVNGARAEWDVFVNDPDTNEPRFLVVQAAADSISADSVNLLTLPEPVTHVLEPDAIASYVGEVDPDTDVETLYFSSSIDWPQSPETRVTFTREFVAANDYIFWGNAVADRGLYNSTVYGRDAVLVDPNQFSFVDNSIWSGFINAEPVHALVYLNPLEIVISPWWNLDAPYLDVTEEYRLELIDFKNGFYPSLVQDIAKFAIRGEALALSTATTTESARYHFSLLDPVGLLTAVSAPGAHTPLPVALFDGEAAAYYLTLTVYHRENDPCGYRAEWTTYVAGPDGRPESLRLDAFATEPCLNPVSLMSVATDLAQGVAGGLLSTHITSPFTRFEASIDLTQADDALAGENWLEAGDRVCSLNGICDDFFYDGALLLLPALRAEYPAVQIHAITTSWDAYIDTGAARAGVRVNPAIKSSNPWRTLRTFAADAPVP
jgi:hypothetical protein